MRSAWIEVSLVCLTLAAMPAMSAMPAPAAEVPHRLADIQQPSAHDDVFDFAAEPTGFVQVGGRLLFSTVNESSADEGILWSTDGTATGTVQISSSLCPASCSQIAVLAVWRDLAFLRTSPQLLPVQLWRTDGTAAGTFPLRGAAGEELTSYDALGDPGSDAVYFDSFTPSNQLWRSDGTSAGTVLVRAADGNAFDYPRSLTFWQRPALLRGRASAGVRRPVDGTLDDRWNPGRHALLAAVEEGDSPARLVATPSHLFFTSGSDGKDLWATDGTPAGTRRLADLPLPPAPRRPIPDASLRTSTPWRRSATRSISRC